MLKILSYGIKAIPNLGSFIEEELELYSSKNKLEAVAGWGYKKTSVKARALAKKESVPYIALEDGFVRSVGLGVNGSMPLSLSVDSVGCYYDADKPSAIERLLEDRAWCSTLIIDQAKRDIASLIRYDISKYNQAPSCTQEQFLKIRKANTEPCLLIIDQCKGDASLTLGKVPRDVAKAMLRKARALYPHHQIYLKVHPDVLAGKKEGLFGSLEEASSYKIQIITEDLAPLSLLKNFEVVFTASSQMGFEALFLGKKVHCFGLPFYAGYGLTEDEYACDRREAISKKQRVTLEELFSACYYKLCRYINPITGKRTTLADTIDFISLQRSYLYKFGRSFVALVKSAWKKELLSSYLSCSKALIFVENSEDALRLVQDKKSILIQWASKADEALIKKLRAQRIPYYLVEDGFIRSRGLGTNYAKPFSLAFDAKGIYYDPTYPSDLDDILNGIKDRLDLENLESRADRLISYMADNSITKYNLKADKNSAKIKALKLQLSEVRKSGRKIVLVPGQVEADASVKKAGCGICTNLELLEAVRKHKPSDFIIYKPHPDVVSLNRKGMKHEEAVSKLCDLIVCLIDINVLYAEADEVHVWTSQSGFEALMRNKAVYVYGLPFYSGWGLCNKEQHSPFRRRALSLRQLVAGALILYPVYFDWCTGFFARPEDICFRLNHAFARPHDSLLVKVLNALSAAKRRFRTKQY